MSAPGAYPLVSVIMPVWNAVETVGTAIQSIRAQTLEDWELLVMDDGSTDGSRELLSGFERDPRVRLCAPSNHAGVSRRSNEALELAQGRFVARMDADDVAYPERLERQFEYMQSHPEVDLVGSPMLVIGEEAQVLGRRSCPAAHEQICARPRAGFAMFQPTFFGRAEWFRRHRYDSRAIRCEDQDLLLRSYGNSRFANLPDVLLAYREERIRLARILRGRWHYIGAVARHEMERGKGLATPRLLVTAAEHSAKGAVETVAVTLRLERVILRHRARPVAKGEESRWRAVEELVAAQGLSV